MHVYPLRIVAAAAIMLSILNACSLSPAIQADRTMSPADWQQRQQLIQTMQAWFVIGRIAMQSPDDAWSASMDWKQAGNNYDINLYGPLGGRVISIEGRPDQVILTNDDGETYTELNASQLIYRHTGWQIPVEGLRHWARAIAAPGDVAEHYFDESGRLSELRQSDWVIRYQDYQQVNGLMMPRKLRLTNKYLTVKMIIRDWRFQLPGSGI